MTTVDPNLHYDYSPLVAASVPHLLIELAEAHSAISNLCIRVSFLRQEELRGMQHAKEMRYEMEGLRDAYVEKKWLIKAILEHRGDS